MRILPKAILIALLFYSFIAFFSSTKAFATPPQSCSADKPYEIIPSCVTCGDTLFCYGYDYALCPSDPIPASCQAEGSGERSCSPDNFPSGTVLYNGETFTVPDWVYYCNDNVFGCANPACAGAAGAPSKIDVGFNPDSPAWGENIPITRYISSPRELENQEITVKPERCETQFGNICFPDLSKLTNFVFRALPFQLPQSLSDTLSIPEVSLLGSIHHPTCAVLSESGEKISGGVGKGEGRAQITTPPIWTKLLGSTKIGQAIGVPGYSSTSNLIVPSPPPLPGDEANEPLADCPEAPGPKSKTIAATTEDQTEITISGLVQRFFDWLGNTLRDIGDWLAGRESAPVTVVVKPKKLVPGEDAFKNQASGEKGMFRAFCPQSLCSDPESEQDESGYSVEGKSLSDPIGLEFKGVCGARAGANLLIQSLFPAGFGTPELEECK